MVDAMRSLTGWLRHAHEQFGIETTKGLVRPWARARWASGDGGLRREVDATAGPKLPPRFIVQTVRLLPSVGIDVVALDAAIVARASGESGKLAAPPTAKLRPYLSHI
jgi:hypothetical protein